jgi:DNA-binding transcriptional MerR regulator
MAMHESAREVDRAQWPYRMKDLVELTGLPRQVIHFYIQQGLLPEGHKTGRNMAYYRDEHVARIKLIRQLQHERFLPLKAIRAIFEQRDGAFSPVQQRLLADVKPRLEAALGATRGERARLDADAVLARAGLTREDLAQMVEAGLLGAADDAAGHTLIAADDAWMLELWGEFRRAGFSVELGFTARDLSLFDDAVSALFAREAELLTQRLVDLAPERVAEMVARALPLINTFLARYHTTKVRNFFAAM